MRPVITEHQQAWEKKFNEEVPALTGDLTDYACTQAEAVVEDWQKLAIYLMTRFRDGQEYKAENGVFQRDRFGQPLYPSRPAFPEEYLRTIAPNTLHE